jgi:hypothetical protein
MQFSIVDDCNSKKTYSGNPVGWYYWKQGMGEPSISRCLKTGLVVVVCIITSESIFPFETWTIIIIIIILRTLQFW